MHRSQDWVGVWGKLYALFINAQWTSGRSDVKYFSTADFFSCSSKAALIRTLTHASLMSRTARARHCCVKIHTRRVATNLHLEGMPAYRARTQCRFALIRSRHHPSSRISAPENVRLLSSTLVRYVDNADTVPGRLHVNQRTLQYFHVTLADRPTADAPIHKYTANLRE